MKALSFGTSVILSVLVLAVPLADTASPAPSSKGFFVESSRISTSLKKRMTGKSWHRSCPVPIKRLRLMRVSYHDFDGERQIGKLVVNKDAVEALTSVLRSMYRKSFKIRRMYLVDRYDADDRTSMRHDNTSAFNCRKVSGTDAWSEHAYGRAIDVNPVENPYVSSGGSVRPRKGRPYADRSQHTRGMIHAGGPTVRAFKRAGWGWGGNWSSAKDYQHFSASGS